MLIEQGCLCCVYQVFNLNDDSKTLFICDFGDRELLIKNKENKVCPNYEVYLVNLRFYQIANNLHTI